MAPEQLHYTLPEIVLGREIVCGLGNFLDLSVDEKTGMLDIIQEANIRPRNYIYQLLISPPFCVNPLSAESFSKQEAIHINGTPFINTDIVPAPLVLPLLTHEVVEGYYWRRNQDLGQERVIELLAKFDLEGFYKQFKEIFTYPSDDRPEHIIAVLAEEWIAQRYGLGEEKHTMWIKGSYDSLEQIKSKYSEKAAAQTTAEILANLELHRKLWEAIEAKLRTNGDQ